MHSLPVLLVTRYDDCLLPPQDPGGQVPLPWRPLVSVLILLHPLPVTADREAVARSYFRSLRPSYIWSGFWPSLGVDPSLLPLLSFTPSPKRRMCCMYLSHTVTPYTSIVDPSTFPSRTQPSTSQTLRSDNTRRSSLVACRSPVTLRLFLRSRKKSGLSLATLWSPAFVITSPTFPIFFRSIFLLPGGTSLYSSEAQPFAGDGNTTYLPAPWTFLPMFEHSAGSPPP